MGPATLAAKWLAQLGGRAIGRGHGGGKAAQPIGILQPLGKLRLPLGIAVYQHFPQVLLSLSALCLGIAEQLDPQQARCRPLHFAAQHIVVQGQQPWCLLVMVGQRLAGLGLALGIADHGLVLFRQVGTDPARAYV